MSDNIKVVVKVRPLISREIEDKLPYQWRVKNNTLYQLDQNSKDLGPCFTFDQVYDKETQTSDIYNDIAKPIVEAAIAGFNGTIFAYGQTSSGKTYTMTGTADSPGIIPLAVCNLFTMIKNVPDRDFLVRVSYIEIYNETVKDLLSAEKNIVKIHETIHGLKVDCKEEVTTTPEEVLKFLKEGEASRQTGATNMNDVSSRSHSIFQIIIESREHIDGEEEVGCVNVSQLNLVDLAGSERAGQTGATGKRFIEGTHINKSLSVLALVIKQLSEGQSKHVSYRDSKLTRILQNSLGGNAKTSIICAITPAAVEETISTLQFANRAKAIKNKPEVNAVATNATMIQSLTKQLSKLQSQLESKKNLEVMLESRKNVEHVLQKQIANLQRLILNGFGTRSSLDMMASRRKLVPPRRITISTLHPIEEDSVPSIPKFHTPLLKYNPSMIPGSMDFVPIQNSSKLTCLPEEGDRLITPPPPDKKVNYNDEIIELDSDDDNSTLDTQTCSPYHKCYGSSKTPPCVLRKNAKLAERNLKDIVELTQREKTYAPEVVEYIEKLEQKSAVIAQLTDNVNILEKLSKEKDLEIDLLKVKVTKSNEEIKSVNSAKMQLEALCKEYTTKLTDWEVSYDTLKSKTKRREDELLSLLDEQKKHKPVEYTSKLFVKNFDKELNFMDMSKDISLVNSDNESMTNVNDDETTSQVQDLVTDLQNQLTRKSQCVIELESEIMVQKQKILSLENFNLQLQKITDDLKDKVNLLELENTNLQSTIETLNSTIKSQKFNLETAGNDIDSYNSVIQELQIKLSNRENIRLNLDDNTLEEMIANEEKFIANNDNIKNIIYSFKLAVDSRNREIDSLKSAVENNLLESNTNSLQEQLTLKEEEIAKLNEKAKYLQDQIDDNVIVINKLIQEKNNLKDVEQQITTELSEITNQFNQLQNSCKEQDLRITNLKENNDKLIESISNKDITEKELLIKHDDMTQNINKLDLEILKLQEDIKLKDDFIQSLNSENIQSSEYIHNANSILNVLLVVISTLNGNPHNPHQSFDNLNDIFTSLNDNMNNLQDTLLEIMRQKDSEIQKYIDLKNNHETTNENLKLELTGLQSSVQEYQKTIQDHISLKEEMKCIISEQENLRKELDSKINIIAALETKLNDTKENVEKFCSDKDNTIRSLKEKENDLCKEIEKLNQDKKQEHEDFEKQISNLTNDYKIKKQDLESSLHDKQTNIDYLENTVRQMEKDLHEKSIELENIRREVKENTDEKLFIVQEKAKLLAEQNLDLTNSMTDLDSKNKALLSQMEEIKLENNTLNQNLTKGNETLEVLKIELNNKVNEIDNMVRKTQELKDQFSNLDIVMKEQMQGLQDDNEKLAARCSELEINSTDKNQSNKENENIKVDHVSKPVSQSVHEPVLEIENKPLSLLTICYNKMIEIMQSNEISGTLSDLDTSHIAEETIKEKFRCECDMLSKDLRTANTENLKLAEKIELLQTQNQQLIFEQEQVRREVQLLLQPAYELQKKINSHKTNLSTLTATTHAENKSLRSQVKVLQHHHSRFHNVCQRDLPVVKKQLNELMSILKAENSSSHNASFKRFSLPSVLLDNNNSSLNNFKNESTLDSDLLMLDTNVTLTTSADNTLMGLDQTCLDMTQNYTNIDVGCQTQTRVDNDQSYTEVFSDNVVIIKEYIDSQSSPLKIGNSAKKTRLCHDCEVSKQNEISLKEEIQLLIQKLDATEAQKVDIQKKYNNLALEIPSTDALLKRINIFEKELNGRVQEVTKLTHVLNHKTEELKQLQQENDSLSTQVMENISENDDLNKELEVMKDNYKIMTEKCTDLEKILRETTENENGKTICAQCQSKQDAIKSLQKVEVHSKLNRSLSDSDTSTRFNKISTLQSELHAGREDCKELTKEVTVIKHHLDRSNLSIGQNMDLDDSMGEPNIYSYTKDFDNVGNRLNKYSKPKPKQDMDIYTVEKVDCINYFVEKTGADKENLDFNVKIIDIMKMFYTDCIMKHHHEVENLVNKIKCFEESRHQLENQVKELAMEYATVTKKLEEREHHFKKVSDTLSLIRQNVALINETVPYNEDHKNTKFVANFKENFLKIMDGEFGFSSALLFENLIDNLLSEHKNNLTSIMNEYSNLQKNMDSVHSELNTVNENIVKIKSQLTDKENECNLLRAQKEKIHEISNAVTLDIVKKEQELCQTIAIGYTKLIENNIISVTDIDKTLPLNSINLIFDRLINEFKHKNIDTEKEKDKLYLEIKKSKTELEESQKTLEILKLENNQLKDINQKISLEINKQSESQIQLSVHEELNRKYVKVVEENKSCFALIQEKDKEITSQKEKLLKLETALRDIEKNNNPHELSVKETKITELLNVVTRSREEIDSLKNINAIIINEKETVALELEKTKDLLKINTIELDKMTADVLVLRESVKDNISVIDALKSEAKSLLAQNMLIKEQFEEKCRDCSRLEMNIKTHEKTAEIQSKMIIRHQKQKEEDDKAIAEKDKRLEELAQKITHLQNETAVLKNNIMDTKKEMDEIKSVKEALELRFSQVENDFERINKPRLSIDPTSESVRRRRQSIHDSNRMFSDNQECQDHNKLEAVFDSRAKPVDMFMDVDEDHSNRSTPLRNSKGRNSSISKHDQSDEPGSRPSSVAETRKRRQSIHDLHRSGMQQTPSPHERPSSKLSESIHQKSTDVDDNTNKSEVSQLREKLSACQKELDELKEQYRELDEECETCSQYLQERDEQCTRLMKEKISLEKVVSELRDKLQSANFNKSQQERKPTLCNVSVNTDEDWANLHSIVVDRMSFDAEVDKNKKLTKTVEELRFKKQDLKMTLAKMQKALEKGAVKDHSKELESTKLELKSCKQELKELKERYRELDEECETCSTYLQERDEQVRKLKEAKAVLQRQLQEYLDKGGVMQSVRKKRQSIHDQHRAAPDDSVEASTQVSDEFLSYQVERDDSKKNNEDKSKELQRLKLMVEQLSKARASLQQQLAAAQAQNPLCVATGSAIVQHQQLTDVMKENQKLKKINTKLIDICKKRGKKPEVSNDDISGH